MPNCSENKNHPEVQLWQIQLGNGFCMFVFVNIKKQEINAYREIITNSGRFTVVDFGNFDESRDFKEYAFPLAQESMRKEQNIV